MRALHTAATGMMAQQTNVEVISNNIANMNTTAFKTRRPEFQDLIYQDLKRTGSSSSDGGTLVPAGVHVGTGVELASVYRILEQGNLSSTDNPLDMAISGPGYFMITMPNGDTGYTRDGAFALSPTGEIVTAEGFTLQPGLTVPQNTVAVSVNASGEVFAKIDGQVEPQNLGQIQLAVFPNEGGLLPIGDNLFLESAASGTVQSGVPGSAGFGQVNQGYLETSNVNAVSEVTSLITAQRTYEMNSKVIQSADEMLKTLANKT